MMPTAGCSSSGHPFLVLATVGADGRVDASPRGDHPGFVQVPDRHTLLIPDRPGNNRIDSLTNLVERPGAAVIFMIPGVDETLRVNGSIAIDDDEDLRQRFAVGGRIPATVLVMARAAGLPALRQGVHALQALGPRELVGDPARADARGDDPRSDRRG